METIILGLGNMQFGDDGAGVLVARALKPQLASPDLAIEETSAAGLDLIIFLEGFKRAIIVDAVQTPGGRPGAIYRFKENQVNLSPRTTAHSIDLLSALKLGRELGMDLPLEITLFGIETPEVGQPGEGCSPAVQEAIPLCVDLIKQEVWKPRSREIAIG